MSAEEWVLQKSPRVSKLADVNEVVNSPLCEVRSQHYWFARKKRLGQMSGTRRWQVYQRSCFCSTSCDSRGGINIPVWEETYTGGSCRRSVEGLLIGGFDHGPDVAVA